MHKALFSTVAIAALAAIPALAQTVVAYDSLSATFETEREVVEAAQKVYGESVVYENGEELPEEIDAAIVPGRPLPADAPTETVDPELAALIDDKLPAGARWVEVGPHLVALDGRELVILAVYDAVR